MHHLFSFSCHLTLPLENSVLGTFLASSASLNNMQLETEKFYNPCTSFVLLQVCKPRTQLSNSKFHTRTAWQLAQSAQLESAGRSLGQQMQSKCVARALVFLIYRCHNSLARCPRRSDCAKSAGSQVLRVSVFHSLSTVCKCS